jgi:hypothetical protein
VFPVRYGLNLYINLLRNSVFKGLIHRLVTFNFPAPYSVEPKCPCCQNWLLQQLSLLYYTRFMCLSVSTVSLLENSTAQVRMCAFRWVWIEGGSTRNTYSGIYRRGFTDLILSFTTLNNVECTYPLLGNDRDISIHQPLLSNGSVIRHVSTAMMEETFSTRSVPRCYKQGQFAVVVTELLRSSRCGLLL